MRAKELREALRRVPRAPAAFPYGKDDYALLLLKWVADSGRPIRALRASPFARLLERPRVKEVLRRRGDGRVDQLDFALAKSGEAVDFVLTWGRWGTTSRTGWDRGWHQMARRGLSLVVQLNLPADHVRDYRRLVKPTDWHPFLYYRHPNARGSHPTLAWARIDLDLARREALIEEIQSDWVNRAAAAKSDGCGPGNGRRRASRLRRSDRGHRRAAPRARRADAGVFERAAA